MQVLTRALQVFLLLPAASLRLQPYSERLSVLSQDHYKYDNERLVDVVIRGNQKLYDIMLEKEKLYI